MPIFNLKRQEKKFRKNGWAQSIPNIETYQKMYMDAQRLYIESLKEQEKK